MWPDADKTKRLLEGSRNGDHAAAKRSVDRERPFAGLEYYRQRKRSMESFTTVRASGLKKASQEGAAVPAKVVVYGG